MSVRATREAATHGEWQAAYELLQQADSQGLAGPDDLALLAQVAYAAGYVDPTIVAWERAHAACLLAGDSMSAAAAAVRVAMHLLFDTALMSPVRGWLAEPSDFSRPTTRHRPTPGSPC